MLLLIHHRILNNYEDRIELENIDMLKFLPKHLSGFPFPIFTFCCDQQHIDFFFFIEVSFIYSLMLVTRIF